MKPLKINRTNDAVFKNIFANKKHKAITIRSSWRVRGWY